ncbi:MAG: hypothetical protein Q9161_002675 [Pseudevernia consocians]
MDPDNDEDGVHSDDMNTHNGLRSNLARNQDILTEPASSYVERADRRSKAKRPRNEYKKRKAVRTELYNHSLLALKDHTRWNISRETLHQILNIRREKSIQDVVSSVPAWEEEKMLKSLNPETLTSSGAAFSTWLVYELLTCRNMALSVYANCKTLQASSLAGDYFSILVLCEASVRSRQNVVSLKRVSINDVQGLAESFVRATRILPSLNFAETSVRGTNDMAMFLSLEFFLLMHTFGGIHTRCNTLFDQLGLVGLVAELELGTFRKRLDCGKNEPSAKDVNYFSALFARWRCALEILDFGILAYEGAHVSRFDQHIFDTNIDEFSLPEYSLCFLPLAHERAHEETCVHFYRLRMNCLAEFVDNSEVWVLGRATDPPNQALYLSTDIETFADVWGPVWKVADQSQSGMFSRYNVGGGSIIPWPWDSSIHPSLEAGERLCHWKNNNDYIKFKVGDSSDLSEWKRLKAADCCRADAFEGSSSTSSDSEEPPDLRLDLESFGGSITERLLVGADSSKSCSNNSSISSPRLRWKRCHCSIDDSKQQLKESGRLDHMIASKSYRYVDSQQTSLVVGSHGVQAGQARTIKNKREETLKASLLDRWENESESRDPREFENLWGVAVSLCTMNARRVRLVEILGEASVVSLLRQFPWSDADKSEHDPKSTLQKEYFKAVRSADPLSLGKLWEDHPPWREELGNALLLCLRILVKTGYDENRDEFHILWTPPRCRSPRRITLKSKDQTWMKFLKDTTSSMTIAVAVEDSLGSDDSCDGNRSQWNHGTSILETAICVNRSLDPASTLIKIRGCRDEDRWLQRIDLRKWRHSWDVSNFDGRHEHFWMDSQSRLRSIRSLNQWCLLLEMDKVKRLLLRELVGMRPSEQLGHWEYTDEEAESTKYRPIPVHIRS